MNIERPIADVLNIDPCEIQQGDLAIVQFCEGVIDAKRAAQELNFLKDQLKTQAEKDAFDDRIRNRVARVMYGKKLRKKEAVDEGTRLFGQLNEAMLERDKEFQGLRDFTAGEVGKTIQ